jgi:hypothetical protein
LRFYLGAIVHILLPYFTARLLGTGTACGAVAKIFRASPRKRSFLGRIQAEGKSAGTCYRHLIPAVLRLMDTSFHSGYLQRKGRSMADHQFGEEIEPEVASHLAQSMDEAPGPEALHHVPPAAAQGQQWPDGSGKHRHPKDRDTTRGRQGQQVADAAIHRQSRPQMPHHD